MATVGVDDGSLQSDSQLESVGLVWGLVLSLHSWYEPSDDGTVNIVHTP